MKTSDSWRRARHRLNAALAWSTGAADDVVGEWDDEDDEREACESPGREARPALRVVGAEHRGICVVAVATYDDAQRVADAFRRDTPVVVDLGGCDPEVARRVTDFCSGLTYAREGSLCPIAERLFLLSPAHVELSGGAPRGPAGGGFYNQA